MKSGLADQAANRKENKRDGAAVRQRVIAHLGRAYELAASGALASSFVSGAKSRGAMSVVGQAYRRTAAIRGHVFWSFVVLSIIFFPNTSTRCTRRCVNIGAVGTHAG
jgi:hypothetical protein